MVIHCLLLTLLVNSIKPINKCRVVIKITEPLLLDGYGAFGSIGDVIKVLYMDIEFIRL